MQKVRKKSAKKVQDHNTETRKKELQELLSTLKTACEEGRSRVDQKVQELEKEICEKLKIAPESWIHKDKALEDVISQLEQNLEKLNGSLQSRKALGDAEVLIKASGGHALQGIFLSNNADDLLTDRATMLQCPENVVLRGPSISSLDVIEQFNSKLQEDTYRKSVDILGYGISVSGSAPVYGGLTINAGVAAPQRTEDEKTTKGHQKVAYSSTVKLSSVHVASYTFDDSDLKLSSSALDALKRIQEAVQIYGCSSPTVQELCDKFYHKYGSHANKGPIHFGGTFCWTCSTSEFEQSELNEVKRIQSKSLECSIGATFMGFGVSTQVDISSVTGRHRGNLSERTKSQTRLEVSTMGGPPEVNSLPEWKAGLVANNDTWCITKRDDTLIPIWEIIEMNHKKLGQLSQLLKQFWERIVGVHTKQIHAILYKPEKVIEEVEKWNSNKPFVIDTKFLIYLLEVKNDILSKSSNSKVWIEVYLTNRSVQAFLCLIMKQQISQASQYITFLVKQLVEEADLDNLTVSSFPEKDHISNWLYKSNETMPIEQVSCKDLENFIRYLEKLVNKMKIAKAQMQPVESYQASAAEDVALALFSVELNMRDTYVDAFLATLVHPFIVGSSYNPVILKPLSIEMVEYLNKQIRKQTPEFSIYQKQDRTQLQAYLFNLALIVYEDCSSTADKQEQMQLQNHLSYLKNRIGNNLEFSVVLDRFITKDCKKADLQSALACLLMNNSLQPSSSQNGQSIEDILSRKVNLPKVKNLNSSPASGNLKVMLEKLGLSKYYPHKLTLQDALCIRRRTLNAAECSEPKQLPYFVLHKIMAKDYRFRSNLLPECDSSSDSDSDSDNDSDSDCSDSSTHEIHPMDCLICLIHCADDFLRQDMMTRIASCQLALPLILPDFSSTQELTLNLWSMQSIVKEWKSNNANDDIVEHEQLIVTYEAPIISFVRLGMTKSRVSKSKLLNDIISNSHYDHFFHRDCNGGMFEQLLGDGLVEICWYLPTGKEGMEDVFPDATTFLNLHGNACDQKFERQVKFLSKVSSMNFILFSENEVSQKSIEVLKQLSVAPGGMVLLTESNALPSSVSKSLGKISTIKLSGKNVDKIQTEIRKKIKKHHGTLDKRSIESCFSIAQQEGIRIKIDEDNELFKQGQTLAQELLNNLKQEENMKNIMLPLQGKHLWQEWAKHDKEQHRQLERGNTTIERYTSQKEREKKDVRIKQLQSLDNVSAVMISFITSLLNADDKVRNYYLQCLKLALNSISRDRITTVQHKYHRARSELTALQNETNAKAKNSSRINDLIASLEDLHEEMIDISFGLEHLFREIGQVYEAVNHLPDQQYSQLSGAVAELLIDGYPLEIMDGDAAHVPIKWLSAVTEQVVKKLNNPRVFVMSVLGLQSTGKSTMLNTAFGLQFNVSAGRCTRGAYMQLIPIEKEFKASVNNCDYILVIDTEGLRAPELDSSQTQKHDNELATFVIGLANVTLINIYGEVPGDLDDILQTAVHVFIRMRKINLKPSCLFVHQNAEAKTKGQLGRDNFTKKLDIRTCAAAKVEKCEDQYQHFSHVIKYDNLKDVHYFPGLWLGEPPMAPVNLGYSLSAQNLKSHLIEIVKKTKVAEFSQFTVRLNDLWNALLHENFVLSFRNTMEVCAYNSLEAYYNQWDWEFKAAMIEWTRKAEHQIEATDDFIKQKLEVTTDNSTDDSSEENDDIVLTMVSDGPLPVVIKENRKRLEKKMNKYFTESKQSEILIQWKGTFELKLKQLAITEQDKADAHCRQLVEGKRAMAKVSQAKIECSTKTTRRVKEIVASLKQEQDELEKSLENHKLSPKQLEYIKKQKLFSKEKLKEYQARGILTQREVGYFSAYMSTNQLKDILYNKLTIDQIKHILHQARLSEDELKAMFNTQWIQIIEKIRPPQEKQIDLKAEVERELCGFLGRKAEDTLIVSIQGTNASWSSTLELKVIEGVHVTKKEGGWLEWAGDLPKKALRRTLLNKKQIKRAQETTDTILNSAKLYLDTIQSGTYNSNYTSELLHKLKPEIDKTGAIQDLIFSPQYRVDVYRTACGYAASIFEKMVKDFNKKNNPRVYLEEELRGPLLAMFMDEYNQIAHEEAIANTICQLLDKPIQREVQERLGLKVVSYVRSCDSIFTSKSVLKAKILVELGKCAQDTGDLEGFFLYFRSTEQCLEKWIKQYTKRYCEESAGDGTRLQQLAKAEVTALITFIIGRVQKINKVFGNHSEKVSTNAWIDKFFGDEKLRDALGVIRAGLLNFKGSKNAEQQQMIMESFTDKLFSGLEKLKEKLCSQFGKVTIENLQQWSIKHKPHKSLAEIIGCSAQCPFCGEQCDWSVHDTKVTKHHVAQHRPTCVIGYRTISTQIMVIDLCTSKVGGTGTFINQDTKGEKIRYADYKDKYPDWSIPIDLGATASYYWKWFVGQYYARIADHYSMKAGDIPEEWKKLKWKDAESQMKNEFKI